MSGPIRIGALLGRNQSFQAVGSWEVPVNQASLSFNVTSGTHSSGGALGVQVFSSVAQVADAARYLAEFSRFAAPDVSTHDVDLLFWARADAAVDSGHIAFGIGGLLQAVGFSSSPIAYRLSQTGVTTSFYVRTRANVAHVSSFTAYVDDVLAMLDPIDLHPEWEAQAGQIALRDYALSQDGAAYAFAYGFAFEFAFTCKLVPSSIASIVNNWWQTQAPLALTLNTSNAEGTYLVRLVNPIAPFTERMRPDQGLWSGALQLSGLGGSLEF